MFNEFASLATQHASTVVINATIIAGVVALALITRQALLLLGQTWARTVSHTMTLATLPIITFIITKVISGNIALSLGMVGALSIVRFRNPVKSPLELTAYFACISYGIVGAANPRWLVIFCVGILVAGPLIYTYRLIYEKITNRSFTTVSFSEGNEKSIVDVSVPISEKKELLIELNENKNIIHITSGPEYISISLAFDSMEEAVETFYSLDKFSINGRVSLR